MSTARASGWILGVATFGSLALNLAALVGPALLAGLLEPPTAIAALADPPQPAPEEPKPDAATAGLTTPLAPAPEAATPLAPKPEAVVETTAKTEEPAKPAKTPAKTTSEEQDPTDAAPARQEPSPLPLAVSEAEQNFRRIVRAYESMEPENASAAIVVLAGRDMESTVRTLLAMDPRRSGAILDAMAKKTPQTAASITSEMLAIATPAAFLPAR